MSASVTWGQAVALGLLQGLTEFLPVSSTAHMAIAPHLLNMDDPGAAFSAIAQLGPIIAIIAYFRNDLIRYAQGVIRTKSPVNIWPEDTDARLGWYTLLGTIPLAIFGLLLEHKINTSFRSLDVIAVALIVLALVLLVAEKVGRRTIPLEKMTLAQSQIIGWSQVFALVPGASRSGCTITAGLFQGLDRESAARFSFLLSIPAITAAGLYKLLKTLKSPNLHDILIPSLIAAAVAGALAYVVVRWFLGYMKEHDTKAFIIYRIALGIALLYLVHSHKIDNKVPTDEIEKTTPISSATK